MHRLPTLLCTCMISNWNYGPTLKRSNLPQASNIYHHIVLMLRGDHSPPKYTDWRSVDTSNLHAQNSNFTSLNNECTWDITNYGGTLIVCVSALQSLHAQATNVTSNKYGKQPAPGDQLFEVVQLATGFQLLTSHHTSSDALRTAYTTKAQ